MAELLLITPQEILQTTVMGGNVDIDKLNYLIDDIQDTVIEPMLGTELYNKIKNDIENATLSGLYEELYKDFVKIILKYQTAGEYIEVASYTVDNGGIYTHQAENETVPERRSIDVFANKYRSRAEIYVQRFLKWICLNPLPEYKTYQDEVNASKDVSVMNGLYFGSAQDQTKWERYSNTNSDCNCKNDRIDGCCS